MTDEERRAFENLILICPNCHDTIDELEPEKYTVETLERIKEQHEVLGAKAHGWLTEERLAEVTIMIVSQLLASGKFVADAEGSDASAAALDIRARGNQATETSTAMPGTPVVRPRQDAIASPVTATAKVQLPTPTVVGTAEVSPRAVDLELDDAVHLHHAANVDLTTDDAAQTASASGTARSSGEAGAERSNTVSTKTESEGGGESAGAFGT